MTTPINVNVTLHVELPDDIIAFIRAVMKSNGDAKDEDAPAASEQPKKRGPKGKMVTEVKADKEEDDDFLGEEEEQDEFTAADVRKIATEIAQQSPKAKERVKALIAEFDDAESLKELDAKHYPAFVKKVKLIKK